MTITFRNYQHPDDFDRVSDFLIRHYRPGNRDGNWFQPTWEYMHSHPALNEEALQKIAIWENEAQIVAVANYESDLGEVFFQLHPAYGYLKREMLDYATENLFGTRKDDSRYVSVFVPEFDKELEGLVTARDCIEVPRFKRPVAQFIIPRPFPEITLPDGFELKSLADENDLHKINRVLWRGFNHEGEPPEEEIPGRAKMQSGPHFRHDLTIVVAAPDGNFASFCGMWFEPYNRIAYVEPVATDPDYRRMGLGRAAVWEGIRRCGELGARVAYVGSDQQFYKSIGFTVLYNVNCWAKELAP